MSSFFRSYLGSCAVLLIVVRGLSANANDSLPNVLILGDSISIGYAPIVSGLLANEAKVARPLNDNGGHLNCEGTTRGVEMLDQWLAVADWDVIHFNFGLHDLKHVHPETGKNSNDPQHPQQADLQQYEANLRKIVERLKRTRAKLIFATTTPYPDKPGGPLRRADQVAKYNRVARAVMRENGIAINDLHRFMLPRMEALLLPNNVHFKVDGSRQLAQQVAHSIRAALPQRPTTDQWEHLALASVSANITSERELGAQINRLGDQGWQLVSASPIVQNGTTQQIILYFKRPKQ